MRLNLYQRNYLTVSLYSFEETLRLAAEWIKEEKSESGILYNRTVTLSPAKKLAASKLIDQALDKIHAITNELGLHKEHEDIARLIRARMNSCWEELSDSHAAQLKRYGDVDPELARYLDPNIELLAAMAVDLANLFANT